MHMVPDRQRTQRRSMRHMVSGVQEARCRALPLFRAQIERVGRVQWCRRPLLRGMRGVLLPALVGRRGGGGHGRGKRKRVGQGVAGLDGIQQHMMQKMNDRTYSMIELPLDRDKSDAGKPCLALGYCPYGVLAETFPLAERDDLRRCRVFGHE